jgi:hypothetical protein
MAKPVAGRLIEAVAGSWKLEAGSFHRHEKLAASLVSPLPL